MLAGTDTNDPNDYPGAPVVSPTPVVTPTLTPWNTGLRGGIRYCWTVSSRVSGAKEEEEGVTAKVKAKNKNIKKFLGICFYSPVYYF